MGSFHPYSTQFVMILSFDDKRLFPAGEKSFVIRHIQRKKTGAENTRRSQNQSLV